MADKKFDFASALSQLEDTFELYLVKKAPNLPKTIKDLVVVLTPWFTLLVIIFRLPQIFSTFGLSALFGPLSIFTSPVPVITYGAGYVFGMLILAVALVLRILSLPGLFKRQAKGWKLLYWAMLISFVSSIFSYNLFSSLIGTLFSLYFIFQIKNYYK